MPNDFPSHARAESEDGDRSVDATDDTTTFSSGQRPGFVVLREFGTNRVRGFRRVWDSGSGADHRRPGPVRRFVALLVLALLIVPVLLLFVLVAVVALVLGIVISIVAAIARPFRPRSATPISGTPIDERSRAPIEPDVEGRENVRVVDRR